MSVVPASLVWEYEQMGRPKGDGPKKREWVGLPPRPFMYTRDQLSVILNISELELHKKYLWYENRQVGAKPVDKLRAVNIAPLDEKPDWRVSEQELIRWMKRQGLRYYERGWVQ